MGWIFTHKEKSVSVKEFFEKEFSSSEILACKVVGMRTAYMAVKREDVVFAVVCLLDYRNKDYFNFGYKDMDETMWPNEAKCPLSILSLLTDTDIENALNWRGECRKNILKSSKITTLKKGDKIKFDREFSFGRYGKTDVFEVVDVKKGHYFAYKLGYTIKLRKQNLTDNTWGKI